MFVYASGEIELCQDQRIFKKINAQGRQLECFRGRDDTTGINLLDRWTLRAFTCMPQIEVA
jgi:hypothetical protein